MRYVAAIAGILVSILPLVFFYVGTQTFLRPGEKMLAIGMVILTGGLLLLSVALLFTPAVQRVQAVALAATVAAVALILALHRAPQ